VTAKIKYEFMTRSLETPQLKFAGKVALITGGTRGIGAATARRVAELGADVVITGRRGREGRRLVDEINRNGGSADFIQADLAQPDQVRLVVPFTLKAFGRLDYYAFNNAGIPGNNRALVDQTEENFDRVFAVNVKALFLLLQDELKQMIVQGEGGSIVNTASVGGRLAIPTAGHYVASKHAVLGLTKTAAVEYGRYGIRSMPSVRAQYEPKRCWKYLAAKGRSIRWGVFIPLAVSVARKKLPTRLHGYSRRNRRITPDSP
jgi:NAD(P)-dependent dehydrogenase (short-subunit alcohol dehydrogenase family)